MLIELLVLSVLLNQECTIYKIRKNVDKYFFLFCSTSMGSIYPALQKLDENNYVSVKKSMSRGGQKSSVYSITAKGRKYFDFLMQEELPRNPPAALQLASVKIMLLPLLKKPEKSTVLQELKNYYQSRLLDFENFQEDLKTGNSPEFKNLNTDYIKYCIDAISDEINWLKFQDLN